MDVRHHNRSSRMQLRHSYENLCPPVGSISYEAHTVRQENTVPHVEGHVLEERDVPMTNHPEATRDTTRNSASPFSHRGQLLALALGAVAMLSTACDQDTDDQGRPLADDAGEEVDDFDDETIVMAQEGGWAGQRHVYLSETCWFQLLTDTYQSGGQTFQKSILHGLSPSLCGTMYLQHRYYDRHGNALWQTGVDSAASWHQQAYEAVTSQPVDMLRGCRGDPFDGVEDPCWYLTKWDPWPEG